MEKATKRMAFNFLRSYFDVFNELKTDEDKLSFISAIINKQFLDEDPEGLNFIVNLCYKSQKHAIEASVKGWKRANKTDMQGNPMTNPPTTPPTNPTTNPKEEEEEVQEKGKEKVQEKEEVEENANAYNFEVLDTSEFKDIRELQKYYLNNLRLMNAFCNEKENNLKFKDLPKRLERFTTELESAGRFKETFKEYSSYFKNWNRSAPKYSKNKTDNKGRIVANFSNPVI